MKGNNQYQTSILLLGNCFDLPELGVILGDAEGELGLSHALASSLGRFWGTFVDLVRAVGVLSP